MSPVATSGSRYPRDAGCRVPNAASTAAVAAAASAAAASASAAALIFPASAAWCSVLAGLASACFAASAVRRGNRIDGAGRDDLAAVSLRASDAGSWILGADGRLRMDARCREMLGPDGATVSPEDRDAVAAVLDGTRDAHAGGLPFCFSHPVGGTRFGRLFSTRTVCGTGHVAGAHGVVLDETERVAAARELAEARSTVLRAEASGARMLAAVAHDLRQPLHGMTLFADLLATDPDAARDADAVKRIRQGIETMAGILDGVVEGARLEVGATAPVLGTFRLDALLDEIKGAYEARAAAKGIAVTVRGGWSWVRSDRALLGRMIRNLVENALRYTDSGRIDVSAHRTGGRVAIEVRDTGRGIPADQLGLIWEEFHRLGDAPQQHAQGLGLGLSIVRTLAGRLGHEVTVTSLPGAGSTFTLTVEAGERPRRTEERAAPPVPTADRRRLLVVVVDDDPSVSVGLEVVLASAGHDVVSASSGQEAIRMLSARDRVPDVVVADHSLGWGETGARAVSEIRRAAGARIPALLLTGGAAAAAIDDPSREFEILEKPASPATLLAAMERALAAA